MSRTAADLEVQVTVAIEFMKKGWPSFDLHEWGVRVGKTPDGSYGIVSLIPASPAPPQVAADAAAPLDVKKLMAELGDRFESQDMDGIQKLLAPLGVKLEPITDEGDAHDGEPKGNPEEQD